MRYQNSSSSVWFARGLQNHWRQRWDPVRRQHSCWGCYHTWMPYSVVRWKMQVGRLNLDQALAKALLGRSTDNLGHLHTLLDVYENADCIRLHAIAEVSSQGRDAYFSAVS